MQGSDLEGFLERLDIIEVEGRSESDELKAFENSDYHSIGYIAARLRGEEVKTLDKMARRLGLDGIEFEDAAVLYTMTQDRRVRRRIVKETGFTRHNMVKYAVRTMREVQDRDLRYLVIKYAQDEMDSAIRHQAGLRLGYSYLLLLREEPGKALGIAAGIAAVAGMFLYGAYSVLSI